ncbi:MAG: MCE family protein, partial [Chloroflexi bacterium]
MFELLANVKWAAALVTVVALSIFGSRGLLPSSSYDLNVAMPGADGLYPGSDVLIAGSHAGVVTQITLHGSGVLVGISLDPAHSPVHSTATVTLRPKSLLGEKYLDLNPGSGGDALDPGATLPASKVSVATDLQDVINTFDQPTREKLQTVITELGGGFAGRGVDTNQTIAYHARAAGRGPGEGHPGARHGDRRAGAVRPPAAARAADRQLRPPDQEPCPAGRRAEACPGRDQRRPQQDRHLALGGPGQPGLDLPAGPDAGPPDQLPDGRPQYRLGLRRQRPAHPGQRHPRDGHRLRRQGRQRLRHPDLSPGRHQHTGRRADAALDADPAAAHPVAAAAARPDRLQRLRRRRLRLPPRRHVVRGKKNLPIFAGYAVIAL